MGNSCLAPVGAFFPPKICPPNVFFIPSATDHKPGALKHTGIFQPLPQPSEVLRIFREMGVQCACDFLHQEGHELDVSQKHRVLDKGSIFPSPLSNEQCCGMLFPGLLSKVEGIQTWPIQQVVFKMFFYPLSLCQ